MSVIDAHHHLWPASAIADQGWRPDDDANLRRAFEGEEFRALRSDAGVDGSVLMQSVDAADENERLLAYAAADSGIAGVVAWLPLNEPVAARRHLEELSLRAEDRGVAERLAGVRCLIGRGDLDWLLSPESLALFREIAARGLAWDVVPITPQQRASVAKLQRALPELRIVVDHLAAPPVDGRWEAWAAAIGELAAGEQVAIKLSVGVAVLDALPSWDVAFVRRAFELALDAFGPDRAMVGSNWPVVELRAPYATAWRDQVGVLEALVSGSDLDRVLGGTATQWYRLERTTP
ncbi:L-fuconolactonase [Rathayibacter oskolensis]|uniref:L-fuconolactonase n=1 Tax=Rathayibacter oskolensis TaxID=1891671 RepID=A0A1X7PDZ4_9MICO|nr:amidohydrolase family protein [Rathayibacter oskolensis]SMH48992.1 L-fuconolactonase [Rathayibacter oskolensis]